MRTGDDGTQDPIPLRLLQGPGRGARAAPGGADGTVTRRFSEAEMREVREHVASLHLQPGEPVPGWWEACPACRGEGCPSCDGAGWVHPGRAAWLATALAFAEVNVRCFLHLLREEQAGTAAGAEALFALEEVAARFLEAWEAEGVTPPEDPEAMVMAEARRAVALLAANRAAARGERA